MVENDIIEPTDRSRLPLITTKVTPSAITPRIAEDRTTPSTLSMARKRVVGQREADHEDREGDQDALAGQQPADPGLGQCRHALLPNRMCRHLMGRRLCGSSSSTLWARGLSAPHPGRSLEEGQKTGLANSPMLSWVIFGVSK